MLFPILFLQVFDFGFFFHVILCVLSMCYWCRLGFVVCCASNIDLRFLEGVPAAHLISLGLEVSVVSLNLKISIGESDAIQWHIICYWDYQALGAAQISGLQYVGSGVVRM